MKITAEFNSSEELISFINTFGANALKGIESKKEVQGAEVKEIKKETVTEKKEEVKQVDPPKEEVKKEVVIEKKEEIKKEEKSNSTKNEQVKTVDPPSKEKITKEMIRAAFAKLIKTGKAKEAKDITTKYGAKKVPDLKEEDYTAILKEVEELL
ncbi:hypothetical protein [Clostridium tetani]|uniref:hypothetical protein n=1 Tax=Clostridium tetani TaxID=1513 RepID=UPI000627D0C1|nr:hypothetical protein [Clostridium tetani]RXI72114.1 hypothetical protein DP127_07575 [Clostridium tetani]BDR75249.1 hypothetical protein K154306013_09090 [Clostridium tetani]